MNSIKYIFIISISVCVYGCWEEPDYPVDNLNPPLSGKIIGTDHFEELNLLDLSTKNSISYEIADYETRPTWSNDGAKFAFYNYKQSSKDDDSIKIITINNNSIKSWKIDKTGLLGGRCDLTWSPDGNTLAYLNYLDGAQNINYLNTSTGDLTKIPLPIWFTAISWNPDDDKIILCQGKHYYLSDSITYSFYAMAPYATDIENISPFASVTKKWYYNSSDPLHMDWSLDGNMLLISRHLDEIYVLNYIEKSFHMIPTPVRGHSACWSKDGFYVLYTNWRWVSIDNAVNDLHVTNIDGSFDYILRANYKSNLVDWY